MPVPFICHSTSGRFTYTNSKFIINIASSRLPTLIARDIFVNCIKKMSRLSNGSQILHCRKMCSRYSRQIYANGNHNAGHPIQRTFPVLNRNIFKKKQGFQRYCDVLVVGGGSIGASVAYWLKRKAQSALNVVVVEKDANYRGSSTILSVGGLRQQFSLVENIEMSLFGAEFIRNARDYLCDINVNFTPHGYLILASDNGSETIRRNSSLQNELGARNEILTAEKLKTRFPWINTEEIALGCHGLEKEGWFDPWALLMGLKSRSMEYGAQFLEGEIINFGFKNDVEYVCSNGLRNSLNKAIIRTNDGKTETINFALCVIAAGYNSGKVARLANIGIGQGILSIPLPVEPRKRYVYVINCRGSNAPTLGSPLTVDPNGTYFRYDTLSGNYLCGRSPNITAEPSVDSLNVDFEYFKTDVWPSLANRVKAFESVKICNSWAGFYDYNTFDGNGIIGQHPYYSNLYIAAGFSGHGIQQAPAVGLAISELIIHGHFRTIDLSRLGFDRVILEKSMRESYIV